LFFFAHNIFVQESEWADANPILNGHDTFAIILITFAQVIIHDILQTVIIVCFCLALSTMHIISKQLC